MKKGIRIFINKKLIKTLTDINERAVKEFLYSHYPGDTLLTCKSESGEVLDVLTLEDCFGK